MSSAAGCNPLLPVNPEAWIYRLSKESCLGREATCQLP
jgi:hypothetical protein